MKLDSRTEDIIGQILFKMVSIAIQEAGQKMQYTDWIQLDERVRANYMSYVEQIASQIPEPTAPPVEPSTLGVVTKAQETLVEVTTPKPEGTKEAVEQLGNDSAIIQAVVAGHPGIELAPHPPKRNPLACQYCGDVRKSKQSKTMHEKSCKARLDK